MDERDMRELIEAARAVQGAFTLGRPSFIAGFVGAALRARSGELHTGVSMDLACGIGFCAEHAAIAKLVETREAEIAAIVAVNDSGILAPCGRCRELILQLTPRNAGTEVVLPGHRVMTIRELLPEPWLHA